MIGELDAFLNKLDSDYVMDRQFLRGNKLPDVARLPATPPAESKKPQGFQCVLDDADVILVRQLWASGISADEIASKFLVSTALITSILRRKRRGNVR